MPRLPTISVDNSVKNLVNVSRKRKPSVGLVTVMKNKACEMYLKTIACVRFLGDAHVVDQIDPSAFFCGHVVRSFAGSAWVECFEIRGKLP